MEAECWICKQKAEWKNEKINQVRKEAKQYAIENEKTVAIYKEGCNYKYTDACTAESSGYNITEYVSQYSNAAT